MVFWNYLSMMGNNARIMCVYNEKYFTTYVEKVKDVECEEESRD